MGANKTVTFSAPGKLMLLGEHVVVYGYPCIVSAVDRSVKVSIRKTDGVKDLFVTPNVSNTNFVEAVIDIFRKRFLKNEKIHLETKSELGSIGLGSSAAVTVATIASLVKLFGIVISDKELFELSYQAILAVQKKGSGFDAAVSIWGGTLFFDGSNKSVENLLTESLPMLVAFSGKKVKTVSMIDKLAKLKKEKLYLVNNLFRSIGQLVIKGKEALKCRDWINFGKFMNENQKLLNKLGVSNIRLNKLVATALREGAYGAKISGAGGGDCMIALVSHDRKDRVGKAIENTGGKLIDLKVGETRGVREIL